VTGKDAARVELLPPSFTLRVGNRRLTMSRRPRKPVPTLLTGLLRRSWRAMFGKSLRISVTAAAICAAWNVSALAAAPPVNTLPTGGAITYGNATITQNGNTLNINQTSGQAIGSFTTFSIGANAVVDISQPNAAAAFLARVTGSDPSLIYGLLKSNGTVALINQNGILVGPTGVVDVARFIASTLNISDSDFLAGRLTFNNGATAGSVENQGTIKSATGGSVYLIGANVTNSGVITSPNGEILLAAGQTVQLVDTATPGVSVNVTGAAGSVTNLGAISAAAGRIGIAAGLINNSGNINASSVVSDGGRIFLRASQNLTTTASSNISADGASTGKGGSVVLYSDGAAYIDGDVSAQGAAGKGGYVETSGLKSLDVVKVPTVGSGGTWYIDPYDLEVVSDSFATANTTADPVNAISSNGDSSKIRASTIVGMLNVGTNVTLTTGGGGSDAGNITVSSAINKVGATDSNLTLKAYNNITINADITSSGSALNLTLSSDYLGINSGAHDVNVNHANISLNGGVLNITNGNISATPPKGNLNLNGGSRLLLTQASSGLLAAAVTVDGTSSLLISQGSASVGTFTNSGTTNVSGSGTINVSGDVNNNNLLNLSGSGNVNISGSINNTDTGTINVDATSLHFNQTNSLNTSGNFNVNGGALAVQGGNVSGNVNVASGATFRMNYMNVGNATGATSFTGGGSMTWAGNITLLSDVTLAANGPSLTLDGGNPEFVLTYSGQTPRTFATANAVTVSGRASLDPGVIWNNSGTVNINAPLNQEGDRLSLGGNAQFNNLQGGTVNLTGPTSLIANAGDFNNQAGAALNLGTCSTLDVSSNNKFANAGNITMQAGSRISASTASNSGVISGNGAVSASGDFNNTGVVTLGNAGSLTAVNFNNNVGGTVNGGGTYTLSDTFNNNGTLSPGGDGAIGAINITGKYTPGSAGVVKIDVGGAGVGTYDTLSFGGGIVFGNSGSDVYGSLTTNLLGGYAPTVDTTFNVFSVGTTSTGYFRHVDGSILGTGNNRSMLKARYDGTNGAPVLVMKGSEDITYTGTVESQWKYSSNWQGGILPTAIDNVIVNSGGALSHGSYDGIDTVNSLQLASGSSFYLSGGTLNVGNITSGANFNLGGGNLNLTGTATLSSLSMSNGSTFNGVGTGSSINVTNNFAQNGGVISSDGDVALTQVANPDAEVSGNLMVGSITARNLVLQAQGGSIRQNEVTQLHVRQQLTTASSTGTTLTNSGNQIAAYAGANTGVGDIALINNLNVSDTSTVLLNGITNAAGNVTVDNTGAMATTGSISALNSTLHSTVSLSTHSPLTIGSGGVSAAGNILLSAGNSGSATDNLIINGVVASAGGNINLFAGNSMSVNANISTSAPGQALFNVVNGTVTYAPGVSITDVSGTQIPVAAVVAQVVTPVVTQTIAPAANTVITSTTSPQSTTVTVVPPSLSSTSSTNTATETMTTGGDPGTFGGSDTSGSGKGSTSEKTGTKTASKLYCS